MRLIASQQFLSGQTYLDIFPLKQLFDKKISPNYSKCHLKIEVFLSYKTYQKEQESHRKNQPPIFLKCRLVRLNMP